jgi:hypothetical protein
VPYNYYLLTTKWLLALTLAPESIERLFFWYVAVGLPFCHIFCRATAICGVARSFLAEKLFWQEVCSVICQTQMKKD